MRRKKRRRISLDRIDYESISRLLQAGFSLPETMRLLASARNRNAFRIIEHRLQKGQRPEEFFVPFAPSRYRRFLKSFIRITSFRESIALSVKLAAYRDDNRSIILKNMLYPGLLLAGTCAGVFLFSSVCLPSLRGIFSAYTDNTDSFRTVEVLTDCLRILTVLIAVTACASFVLLRNDERRIRLFLFLEKHLSGNLWTQSVSAEFIRYYLECIRTGLSTKETLAVIGGLPDRVLIRYAAKQIDNALYSGTSFENAVDQPFMDSLLVRLFRIAVYTSESEEILESYLKISADRIAIRLKRLAGVMQAGAYILIGAILIIVYQVLLLPLSMLAQI